MRKTLFFVLAFAFAASAASAQDSKPNSAASPSFVIPASVFAGLQAADVYSTYVARESGLGVEGNAFMDFSTGKQAAVKAAVTVGTVYAMAKVNKRHPKVAKAVLYAMNGAMVYVVCNNYSISKGGRGCGR